MNGTSAVATLGGQKNSITENSEKKEKEEKEKEKENMGN
jgi:hypothetical protein